MTSSFSCRVKSNLLNQLLQCIGSDMRKDQLSYLDAASTGLTFIMAGGSRSVQGQLNLPKALFEQYVVTNHDGDAIRILIDLSLLIECSKLASNSDLSTSTLSYSGEKALLLLSIEEGNLMTVCEMNCLDNNEDEEQESRSMLESFRASPESCQVIIKSDTLSDGVEDILMAVGISSVSLDISATHLKIACHGSVGTSEISLSKNIDGVVLFRCIDTCHHEYMLSSFLRGVKALSTSYEVCFRLNREGILYIQHQILTEEGKEAYLNFLMVPLEED